MKPTANYNGTGDVKSTSPQVDIEAGKRTGGVPPKKMKRRCLVVRTPAPRFPVPVLLTTLIVTPLLIGSLFIILIVNDTTDYGVSPKTKTTSELLFEIQDISDDIRNMLSNEDTMKAMKADGEFIDDILAHMLDTLQRVHTEAKMLAEGQLKKSGMDEGEPEIDSNDKVNLEITPEPSKLIPVEKEGDHIQEEKKVVADSFEDAGETIIVTGKASSPLLNQASVI